MDVDGRAQELVDDTGAGEHLEHGGFDRRSPGLTMRFRRPIHDPGADAVAGKLAASEEPGRPAAYCSSSSSGSEISYACPWMSGTKPSCDGAPPNRGQVDPKLIGSGSQAPELELVPAERCPGQKTRQWLMGSRFRTQPQKRGR